MNKLVKILGIAVLLVVALVVVLLVAAKLFITPERVRDTVLAKAREALGREVTLGEIEVGLSGITLKNLAIPDQSGREQCMAVEQVVLRYQLAPLLSKQVIIDEVMLSKPKLRVVRLANGSYNCGELIPVPGAPPAATEEKPVARQEGGNEVSILVARVGVEGGSISLLDQHIKPSVQAEITNLAITVKDIAPSKSFPVTLKATVSGAPLDMQAEIGPGSALSKGMVKLEGLNLATFSPYFQEDMSAKINNLKLSVNTAAAMDAAGKITLKGKVTAADIDMILDTMKDTPIKGLTVSLDHELMVDQEAALADIKRAVLTVGGIPVDIAGRVSDYKTKPRADLTVQVKELDLAKTIAALPAKFVEDVKPLAPNGVVALKLHMAGEFSDSSKLLQAGDVRLTKVSVASGGMRPEINGTLTLSGNKLSTEGLLLNLGGNTANLNATVENVMKKPYRVTASLSSERFQLEPLIAPAAGGAESSPTPGEPEKTKTAPAPPKSSAEAGPLDLPLSADTNVRIGKASYQGLEIDNFNMHFRLDRNVLTVDKMTGQTAGGSFQNTANVDLGKKGFSYATTLNMSDVRAEILLPIFMPKTKDAVTGSMDLKADFQGAGTVPGRAKKNLGGHGQFTIENGQVATRLSEGLAAFLGTQELRVLRFTRWSANFDMNNGVARVTSECSGSDVRITPNGTVNLVDDMVDLSLGTKLSPQLSARLDRTGKYGPLLADADGWTMVPLKVAGPLDSPGFTLDMAAVAGKVKEKAVDEIQKRLLDKFLPQSPKPSQPSGQGQPSQVRPGDLLREGLRGLFGK